MTNYRRFVAYLYEYENNHKGGNRGVVRIESHGKNCLITLQMKCPNLPEGIPVTVYGFVRKNKELMGIPLGRTRSGIGGVFGKLQTSADHMGNSRYALPQLGGLLIMTPERRIFGTQWDDRPIYPEHFYVADAAPDTTQTPQQDSSSSAAQTVQPETENKSDTKSTDTTAAVASPVSPDSTAPVTDNTGDNSPTDECVSAADTDSVPLPRPAEKEVHITSAESAAAASLPSLPPGFPSIEPFGDEEFTDCIRLTLNDLPALSQAGFPISVNQFLLHGVHNYHHLLLGWNEKKRAYMLGIPGVFDIREQFMASLFGFTGFKESSRQGENNTAFGYWYRPLQV